MLKGFFLVLLKGFFLVLLKGFIDYTEVFFGFTGKLSPDELGTEQEKTALYPRAKKNVGTEQEKTALYPNHWKYYQLTDTRNMMMEVFGQTIF